MENEAHCSTSSGTVGKKKKKPAVKKVAVEILDKLIDTKNNIKYKVKFKTGKKYHVAWELGTRLDPILVTSYEESLPQEEFEVEEIVDKRYVVGGFVEYYIKWRGYTSDSNTWEPEENLNCPELLEIFNKENGSTIDSEDETLAKSVTGVNDEFIQSTTQSENQESATGSNCEPAATSSNDGANEQSITNPDVLPLDSNDDTIEFTTLMERLGANENAAKGSNVEVETNDPAMKSDGEVLESSTEREDLETASGSNCEPAATSREDGANQQTNTNPHDPPIDSDDEIIEYSTLRGRLRPIRNAAKSRNVKVEPNDPPMDSDDEVLESSTEREDLESASGSNYEPSASSSDDAENEQTNKNPHDPPTDSDDEIIEYSTLRGRLPPIGNAARSTNVRVEPNDPPTDSDDEIIEYSTLRGRLPPIRSAATNSNVKVEPNDPAMKSDGEVLGLSTEREDLESATGSNYEPAATSSYGAANGQDDVEEDHGLRSDDEIIHMSVQDMADKTIEVTTEGETLHSVDSFEATGSDSAAQYQRFPLEDSISDEEGFADGHDETAMEVENSPSVEETASEIEQVVDETTTQHEQIPIDDETPFQCMDDGEIPVLEETRREVEQLSVSDAADPGIEQVVEEATTQQENIQISEETQHAVENIPVVEDKNKQIMEEYDDDDDDDVHKSFKKMRLISPEDAVDDEAVKFPENGGAVAGCSKDRTDGDIATDIPKNKRSEKQKKSPKKKEVNDLSEKDPIPPVLRAEEGSDGTSNHQISTQTNEPPNPQEKLVKVQQPVKEKKPPNTKEIFAALYKDGERFYLIKDHAAIDNHFTKLSYKEAEQQYPRLLNRFHKTRQLPLDFAK